MPREAGWEQADFDDAGWATTSTPLAVDGTPQPAKDGAIAARRSFTLTAVPRQAALRVEGWGEFTVWLNGRLVQTLTNARTEGYTPVSMVMLSPQGLAALRPGRNAIAVAIRPTRSQDARLDGLEENRQVDFGVVEVRAGGPGPAPRNVA